MIFAYRTPPGVRDPAVGWRSRTSALSLLWALCAAAGTTGSTRGHTHDQTRDPGHQEVPVDVLLAVRRARTLVLRARHIAHPSRRQWPSASFYSLDCAAIASLNGVGQSGT